MTMRRNRPFRLFLASLLCLAGWTVAARGGEVLYNGIVLPEQWPPLLGDHPGVPPLVTWKNFGRVPVPPYLERRPSTIDISVGRQLFVDDFLIAHTSLRRTWHRPVKHPGNPVLRPEKAWEMGKGLTPMAAPFSDGCFYDPQSKRFLLWYSAGWYDSTALATSRDGFTWERPALPVFPGTNLVALKGKPDWRRDTVSVWLDHDATRPDERFKASMFCRTGEVGSKLINHTPGLLLLASPDGIDWTIRGQTRHSKDNTTMFYNPFRRVWVFSHRIHLQHPDGSYERARAYWETKDFFAAAGEAFFQQPPVFWSSSDAEDGLPAAAASVTAAAADAIELGNSTKPQVYKIDATPYESLMLGLFEILTGPSNEVGAREGIPKTTDLQVAFSRDGFHWTRHRETFIGGTGKPESWDRGYISSTGGGCLVVGDELLFPYGAFRGDPANTTTGYYTWSGLYANGATGIARLRRDGFSSMQGPGELTTHPVRFGGRRLFVNVKGALRVEVLGRDSVVIAPFTKENCAIVRTDSTRVEVKWKGARDLSVLAGKPLRFRFHVENGDLYSFWVSRDGSGRSDGYVAAGGPEFRGPRDE